MPPPPPPDSARPLRAALRVVCWNALLLLGVPGGIAVGYEVWFREALPFDSKSRQPGEFVPGVGRHPAPNAEVRWTNLREFWTVERTNSLGFLDREPPSPERAAASCHVAFVGDSFVEAAQVGIADKLQVRLEKSATERLPQLDVTTSAWGRQRTGQIAQLPYYEKWARRLRPKLVVLVFVPNDWSENSGGAYATDEIRRRCIGRPVDSLDGHSWQPSVRWLGAPRRGPEHPGDRPSRLDSPPGRGCRGRSLGA